MDSAKLEKMKVVDLRNELQSRGLDTKGVKAVLIERLKAHLEGAAEAGGGTPGRRSRRTRSMTRSPSPSPVKKAESSLEPLPEEGSNAQVAEATEDVEDQRAASTTGDEEECESQSAIPAVKEQEEDKKQDEEIEEEVEEEVEEEDEKEEEKDDDVAPEKVAEPVPTKAEAMDVDKEEVEKEPLQANSNEEQESAATAEKDKPTEELLSEERAVKEIEATTDDPMKVSAEQTETEPEKETDQKVKPDEKVDTTEVTRRKRTHSRSRSRSKSRSRSPKRRSGAGSPSKAVEEPTNPEDEPTIEDKQFGLSWFDSDLHLRIDPVTFCSAKPMNHEIYSLVWSGVRTNYGVREGKVCFEVRLAEETQMGRSHQFRDEPHVRGFRVGFSLPNTPLLLGEAENSFAYCESGRKALNSEFVEYAKPYQLDDVIGCYLDLESSPCTIRYTLNGEDLGVAFEFEKSILGESDALFPHIVTKGYEFHVNFADNECLLVNVERPVRKRRKPRKASVVEEKREDAENNGSSNWKVVDETTPNEEENDDSTAPAAVVENAKAEHEEHEVKDQVQPAAVVAAEGDVEMKEAETEKAVVDENTEKTEKPEITDAPVEKKEEQPPKDTEELTSEPKSADITEEVVEKVEKEPAEPASDDAEKPLKNGEELKDSEAEAEVKVVAAEEQKPKDEQEKDEKESETSAGGPSPNKRKRKDTDESKRRASTEDEYEEVVPEPRDPVSLLPGYELIALIPEEKYVPGPQRPASRKECEVIILVGLPGAGKTHWTLNHIKENPEKRYHVVGADNLIAKMTIDGAPRKSIHKGRWDRVYDLCLNSLSSLEEIATKRRRNFILDQTNAYASAQRRKMKGFGDFKRMAVVCIPSEEELKRRIAEKTEKGIANPIRESTSNNLRANFTLPSLEFGWFDSIIYTDLSGDEAKEVVKKYNEKRNTISSSSSSRDNRNRRDHYPRDDRRRNDDRRRDDTRWSDRRGGQSYQGGGGGGNRWGAGGGGGTGGWRDDRGYGGGGGGGRGYDNRNRYGGGAGSGGGGGAQSWLHNNRTRYDDRYNRSAGGGGGGGGSGGGGGGRYDSYGGVGGGGGGSRDYRERDRDRNGGGGGGGGGGGRRDGGNYRSSGNQRDFRPGHRDNHTEGNRGGYERPAAVGAAAASLPMNIANESYDQYNNNNNSKGVGGKTGGKWSTYGQQRYQAPPKYNAQQQQQAPANWGQQQYQPQQQQQQYWGYNETQGYGNQQQQWQGTDPSQQQEWASWWQQQQQQHGSGQALAGNGEANSYWSQYSYGPDANARPPK